ncbi:MAG: hypothetical protein JSW18_03910 [Candidatus Omnitrophota bacterium]|nr:MAG: hypothetical protein JSW18_03910 [Candidatus Omnitrophota bacterium]
MGNFKRYFIVIIAILCFIGINSAIAISADGIQEVKSLSNLSIPDNFGTIKDKYINNYSDLLIVHIQDLHCNYDAQQSIYKMLDKLVNEHDFKLVTVEGSVGRLETAPFSNYPDEEIKAKVARYFVKRGRIDGAAYAHIMNKSSFAFWGADNTTLYKQNAEAFRGSLDTRAENNAFCGNIKSILGKFKQKAYNKKLLMLDNQIQAYKNEEVSFGEFAVYLNGLIAGYKIEKENWRNFNKLIMVLELEKDIDFTLVDTQRSKCIEKLSKRLKDENLSKLLDMSLHFKTADIGAVEFYSYLKEVVDNASRVNFEDYPELGKYIDYILVYNDIKHMGLFEEINRIQDAIKNKQFMREIERDIDRLSKNIEVLKNLANLKLTTKTLDYYRKNRSQFLASNFINFITENAPKYRIKYTINPAFRKIDARLPDLEKFYSLALERDKILVDNTVNKMNQINIKQAILVAGGFHTEGIIDALKKKGISYLVVTPKVNELDEENNPYISVLMNERTPFEEHLHKQLTRNKRSNPDAIVFQQAAKYFADAHKLIFKNLSKEKAGE